MIDRFPFCPQPPDWRVDWDALDRTFHWIQNLRGCAQDPLRHAEGDVWTHVRMVCDALVALETWRSLPDAERRILFIAALLHDVAKPACLRTDPDGKISTRGHSWRGAIMGRRILWRMGIPFAMREQIAALVRHHLVPLYLIEREEPQRLAIEVSQTARCDLLAILSEADARGRICPDPQKLLGNIARFSEFCRENNCLTQPFAFTSEQARFLYFRATNRQPDSPALNDYSCEAVLMCGLPGAGKDHWIQHHVRDRPVISVDDLRQELKLPPNVPQGAVLARAREIAREFLRQRQSFVWNAPNLSRQVRQEFIRLFAEHGARVRIVYCEAGPERLFAQNRQRRHRVPVSVIERLLDRWETPDRTEAHQVDHIIES